MRYPYLEVGEIVLYKTARSYRYYWVTICLGIIFGLGIHYVLGIPFLVYLYLRFKKDKIWITDKRVLVIQGLRQKTVLQVYLDNIRRVDYSYSYFARSHSLTFVTDSGSVKLNFLSGAYAFKVFLEKLLAGHV